MIAKTRAVVLREIKYRDQSKICTLYTREFGKLTVMLKGVRNPKSRMAGIFAAGNTLDALIYRKQGRDIQLATDGNLIASPMVPEPDMERYAVLYAMLDRLSRATEQEERNVPLYTALEECLGELCRDQAAFSLLHAWFLLRFISLLGFEPSLARCACSGAPIGEVPESGLRFVMDPGGLAFPAAAGARGRPLPREVCRLLQRLGATPAAATRTLAHQQAEASRLVATLQEYCSVHLEQGAGSRNQAIVSRILP